MRLSARSLVLSYGGRRVIDGVSLEVAPGELVVLIGPNGSGKSTLLRGMARLHRPDSGGVFFGDTDLRKMKSREVARALALLPSAPSGGLDLTVRELVWRGRYPHQGVMLRARPEDHRAVRWAVEACDLGHLIDRSLTSLSGGERQRAWLALALAQQPKVMLLDEPTSFLDLRHELEVMEVVNRLKSEGIGIVAALHDLILAARFADRIVALRAGRVEFTGPPSGVMTEAALERVFGVRMAILRDPESGLPMPVPLSMTAPRWPMPVG